VLRAAARGGYPEPDGSVVVVPPWRDDVEGVVSLPGRAYVATALPAAAVLARPVDGFGGATDPAFLTWLGGPGADFDCLDVLLVAEGDARATLPPRPVDPTHPRVRHAVAHRTDVRAYGDERGVVVLGRGVAGLLEVGVEVPPEQRGRGAGRALLRDARGLVPPGEPLLAAVAPGNAASLRAVLAAGFVPIGSVQLLHPGAR
jgi:GNAT superfamily N-acetyltransferase